MGFPINNNTLGRKDERKERSLGEYSKNFIGESEIPQKSLKLKLNIDFKSIYIKIGQK